MTEATMLYVEDEENDLFFMRLAIRDAWAEVSLQEVGNGRDAISYLSGEGLFIERMKYPLPQMVLLDLNLPVMSGFEVLKWIREHRSFDNLLVVIFSSSGRVEDRERARSLGADDYLIKPASGMDFRKIAQHLRAFWLSSTLADSRKTP